MAALLLNVTLEGLKTHLLSRLQVQTEPCLVAYADDIMLLHREEEVVAAAREVIAEYLSHYGLALKPAKIGPSLAPLEAGLERGVGFDFLGFRIFQALDRFESSWSGSKVYRTCLVRQSNAEGQEDDFENDDQYLEAVRKHLQDLAVVADEEQFRELDD